MGKLLRTPEDSNCLGLNLKPQRTQRFSQRNAGREGFLRGLCEELRALCG